jgi:hypothetical protein
MITYRKLAFAMALCLPWTLGAAESDPATYCKQAAELYEAGDVSAAIEEAKWCLESLEQIAQNQKSDVFPLDLAGWKRGEVSQQKAMGISNIEVAYSRDGKEIPINYTGGGGGGMAAMFSQMGMAGAGRKIRLGRYTGMVMEQGQRNEIMIGLKMTPGMLSLESDSASIDELIEFAQALPVADIDQ